MNKIIFTSFFLFLTNTVFPQLIIDVGSTNYTIDFDNTILGVNSGPYSGTGFSASPSNGQLDSDAWAATGMSDGDFNFGAGATTGDFARGVSIGGEGTGGFYAFDVGSNNFAFGIQPGGSDWTPGTVILKIQNNTGFNITSLNVSYDVYIFNDEGKSNSFNFSYSIDNSSYTDVPSLNLVSNVNPDVSPIWNKNSKSTLIGGLNITSGNYVYLRWSGDEVSGSGSMDEFALDNITVNATTGAVSSTLVFFQSTNSSVNEDVGTYNLVVQIQNPSSTNPTTAEVALTAGDNADVNGYSTQMVTFPANSSTSQSISLTITEDLLEEGDETLTFELQNFSGGNSAQGGAITSFDLIIIDNDIPKIVINEILADPPLDDASTTNVVEGDANGDGTRDESDDEFVEFLNNNGSSIVISGWKLFEGNTLRHTFENTTLPAGESVVVFGGGSPTGIPGIVQTASTDNLVLTNSGGIVTLKNTDDIIIDSHTYGAEGNNDESLARNPDATGNFVGHTSIDPNHLNFSPGRDNTDNTALPVELTSFTASIFGNNIELNWQTATEINNYGFEIERKVSSRQSSVHSPQSTVGSSQWQKIGFVHGFGSSNAPHSYNFTDKKVNPGNYSYRLKQIDIDGKFEYSKVINAAVQNNLAFRLKQNYPNPFNPETKIIYSIPQKSYVSLKVFNILGEKIADLIGKKQKAGTYSVEFSINEYELTSGIYFYSLQYKDFVETRKMIILR